MMSFKKIVYVHARRFIGQLISVIAPHITLITTLCIFVWCCTMWFVFSRR